MLSYIEMNLDHHNCSPGSMSGCSTGWARCRWAALWCPAPAPRCAARTSEAGGPPGRSGCQMGRSGAGRCSGTSCCGSGSGSACSPRLRTPQSAHGLFKHKETLFSVTSSATSGPLLTKSPCLVTETRVMVSPLTVTASSLSVFRKMM